MADLKPISDAAELTGVNRNTLARWVSRGRLRSEFGPRMKNGVTPRLVSVSDVRRVMKEPGVGRPPGTGKAAKPPPRGGRKHKGAK